MENLSLTPLDYDEEGCWYVLISEVYMYDLQEQYDRAIDGDADALFNLFLFCSKEDIEVNETLALALLEKAANQGHEEAIYHMGLNTHEKKSIAWLLQGAKQGHPDSQNELGKSYEAGKGVLKDFKSAVEWYTKAAEQDHAGAQYNLGLMFAKGRGLSKDFTEAAKWYRKAAEQGNIDAQYTLYMQANKLNIEIEESIDWLHKSAGKDVLSNAQYNFKNNDELIEHYLESVCKGYAKAQYQLGAIYFKNGGAEDMSKAKYWIEKAYENSDKAISKKAEDFWNKNELWIFKDYSFKNITEPNYEQKIRYTISIADDFIIGNRLNNGIGILRDLKQAIKHFTKVATNKGSAEVQYELGVIYFQENSVKDYGKSKYWINKAYEGIEPNIRKKAKVFWNKHKLWNY
jgi:TPR repeat protein